MDFKPNVTIALHGTVATNYKTVCYIDITTPGEHKHENYRITKKKVGLTDKVIRKGTRLKLQVEFSGEGEFVDILSAEITTDSEESAPTLPEVDVQEKREKEPVFTPAKSVIHTTDEFYISPQNVKTLNVLHSIMLDEGYAVLLLTGPSGWGKTMMGRHIAKQMGLQVAECLMPTIMEAEEFYGTRTFDKKTEFVLHDYINTMEQGYTVMILDEITRLDMQKFGPILPMLDDRHAQRMHNIDITVGDNTFFILTANEGSMYTGTDILDEAFRNRAHAIMPIDSIPRQVEADLLVHNGGLPYATADKIADIMIFLRDYQDDLDASPRMSSYIGKQVKHGASIKEAITSLVLNRSSLSDRARKEITDNLNAREGMGRI